MKGSSGKMTSSTLPFTYDGVNKAPSYAGIYTLYNVQKRPVYIGMSINVQKRLYCHLRKLPAETFRTQRIQDRKLRTNRERELILQHKPLYILQYLKTPLTSIFTLDYPSVWAEVMAEEYMESLWQARSEPYCVAMWRCPINKNRNCYASGPCVNGLLTMTTRESEAYYTENVGEWHALKYFLRRVPTSNGAHERTAR